MPKYNIFVVSPQDVSSLLQNLEGSDKSVSSTSAPTHECLANSHINELNRLTLSAKAMFRFDDLKSHLATVENLPVHNQALSAYLEKNGYSRSKVKDLKSGSTVTVWKHNSNHLFS